MSKPDELQDDPPKFDFTAIPLCGIDGAESTSTLFQDGAATSTTTETLKDQALEASDKVASKDDASILGGESDDVPSSAFIHGDDDEMVEHGIFPSTTATYDDLSDLATIWRMRVTTPLAPYMMSCHNYHVRRATIPTT